MPNFAYVARERSGKVVQGIIDASDIRDAAGKLRQENLLVTKLIPQGKSSSTTKTEGIATRGKVGLKDKMFFTKQFFVMLKAGLGMITCFTNLYNQTSNDYLKHVINEIRKDVEGGTPLSEAMARYPKVFDKMFIHMVEAGEATGKLDNSLERMNRYYEREYKLRRDVVGAMVYPVIIVVVAIIAVIILMTVIMPIFVKMFQGSGKPLPGLTQFMMAISDMMRKFWYLMPVIPGGLFFGYRAARQSPELSEQIDKIWLKVPLFGDLIRKLSVSRFTQTLATLMESGVPILQSLDIVQRVVSNAVVAKGVREAAASVSRGGGLSAPLESTGVFPPMVSQMVAIGEETGDLARLLNEVSDYYDKEVSYAVENLTTMIEPMIIVILGAVVGVIVLSIYLPMFDLSSGSTL